MVVEVLPEAAGQIARQADVLQAAPPIERIDAVASPNVLADDAVILLECGAGDALEVLADKRIAPRHTRASSERSVIYRPAAYSSHPGVLGPRRPRSLLRHVGRIGKPCGGRRHQRAGPEHSRQPNRETSHSAGNVRARVLSRTE